MVALLSGCSITIPNTRVCATAGMMSAGGDCAWTLNDDTQELDLDQWIEFLEPQEGTGAAPAKGAAICQSAEDWNRQKTALEQACRKLGRWCTMEGKAQAQDMAGRVDGLEQRVLKKARRWWSEKASALSAGAPGGT